MCSALKFQIIKYPTTQFHLLLLRFLIHLCTHPLIPIYNCLLHPQWLHIISLPYPNPLCLNHSLNLIIFQLL